MKQEDKLEPEKKVEGILENVNRNLSNQLIRVELHQEKQRSNELGQKLKEKTDEHEALVFQTLQTKAYYEQCATLMNQVKEQNK